MGFTPKRSMVDTSYAGTQILSSSIMQLPVQLPGSGTPACSLHHADAPRQHSEHDWAVTCIKHQGWRQRPAPPVLLTSRQDRLHAQHGGGSHLGRDLETAILDEGVCSQYRSMPNMVEALTWAVTWKLPSPMKPNTRCLPSRACW